MGGGLLCIWDKDFMEIEETWKGVRWLCVKGRIKSNSFSCVVCLVYGPHNLEERRQLWSELKK